MEGMTALEVECKHGLGHATASGIRKHLGELVPGTDAIAAKRFEAVRDMALQRIYEKLAEGEGKLGELSVVAGVSADKLDIIRGRSQPSQVHQHLHISHAAVEDILRAMPGPGLPDNVHGPEGSVDVGMSSCGDKDEKTFGASGDIQSLDEDEKTPQKQSDGDTGAI